MLAIRLSLLYRMIRPERGARSGAAPDSLLRDLSDSPIQRGRALSPCSERSGRYMTATTFRSLRLDATGRLPGHRDGLGS